MDSVNDPQLRTALHAVYKALYETHRASPTVFQPHDLTRMLTGLMGSRPWSWRVIGITPQALSCFSRHGYNKPPDRQIQRGHLHGRSGTAKELFALPTAMAVDEFFKFFLARDLTVLMLSKENPSNSYNRPPPDFIPIDQDLQLFRCGGLVGYQHGQAETNYLHSLHAREPVPMSFEAWAARQVDSA
jgi:hypothetical protein